MKLIEWLDNAINKVTGGVTKGFMKLFGMDPAFYDEVMDKAEQRGTDKPIQSAVDMLTPGTPSNEMAQEIVDEKIETIEKDLSTLTPDINWQDTAMKMAGVFDNFSNKAMDGMLNIHNKLYGIDPSFQEEIKEKAKNQFGFEGNVMQDMVQMVTPGNPMNDLAKITIDNSLNNFEENVYKDVDNIKNGITEILQNSPFIRDVIPKTEDKTENIIEDKTEENIETKINNNNVDWQSIIDQEREKIWAREDAIRKETQQREDTAYQRAVEDMRKAGINPNLVGVSPAQSGGGITNAGRNEYTQYQTELNESLKLLEQEIENEFKGDENKKDRINNLISSVIMALLFRKK